MSQVAVVLFKIAQICFDSYSQSQNIVTELAYRLGNITLLPIILNAMDYWLLCVSVIIFIYIGNC